MFGFAQVRREVQIGSSPTRIDLVLQLQDRVQRLFLDSMEMFGILGLGKKETIRYSAVSEHYEEIDAEERLYRRVR